MPSERALHGLWSSGAGKNEKQGIGVGRMTATKHFVLRKLMKWLKDRATRVSSRAVRSPIPQVIWKDNLLILGVLIELLDAMVHRIELYRFNAQVPLTVSSTVVSISRAAYGRLSGSVSARVLEDLSVSTVEVASPRSQWILPPVGLRETACSSQRSRWMTVTIVAQCIRAKQELCFPVDDSLFPGCQCWLAKSRYICTIPRKKDKLLAAASATPLARAGCNPRDCASFIFSKLERDMLCWLQPPLQSASCTSRPVLCR
nr:hypothetical protein CFP56_02822 [Quercus suber]